MRPLVLLLIFSLYQSLAFSCPRLAPKNFIEIQRSQGNRLFQNQEKNAVIGIKCERLPKVESDKSLQFFSGRIVLDETTSYFSLKESDDAISRIYFKVTDKELIQATVTAKISSAEETKILEKTIVQFIRGAQ